MNGRKLVIFLPDLAGGGAERVMLNLSRLLASAGCSITLAIGRKTGALVDLLPHGIEIIELSPTSKGPLSLGISCIRHLRTLLKYYRPDAVLSTLVGGNLAAYAASRYSKARLIMREANVYSDMASRPRSHVARLIYRRADSMVAVSQPVAEDLARYCKVNPDRLHIIPNPIDTHALITAGNEELPKETCDDRGPLIVSAGRLVPVKGFDKLILAVSRLQREYEVKLVILGNGPLYDDLLRLAYRTLGQENICMPGWTKNPYRWYRHASVVVSTSRWEGCPNVLIEAAALGRKLVAYRRRDTEWLASLGLNVDLAENGSTEDLANALEKTLNEPTRLTAHLPAIFSPDEVTRRYMEVLWNALD